MTHDPKTPAAPSIDFDRFLTVDIRIGTVDDLNQAERSELETRFAQQIYPVLTPLAVGPGQPFPYISGLSLSLGVTVRDPESGEERFARVKVPDSLPQLIAVSRATKTKAKRKRPEKNVELVFRLSLGESEDEDVAELRENPLKRGLKSRRRFGVVFSESISHAQVKPVAVIVRTKLGRLGKDASRIVLRGSLCRTEHTRRRVRRGRLRLTQS